MRAMALIRAACSELSLAVFEWTIADGLVRSGSGVPRTPAGSIAPSALSCRATATAKLID